MDTDNPKHTAPSETRRSVHWSEDTIFNSKRKTKVPPPVDSRPASLIDFEKQFKAKVPKSGSSIFKIHSRKFQIYLTWPNVDPDLLSLSNINSTIMIKEFNYPFPHRPGTTVPLSELVNLLLNPKPSEQKPYCFMIPDFTQLSSHIASECIVAWMTEKSFGFQKACNLWYRLFPTICPDFHSQKLIKLYSSTNQEPTTTTILPEKVKFIPSRLYRSLFYATDSQKFIQQPEIPSSQKKHLFSKIDCYSIVSWDTDFSFSLHNRLSSIAEYIPLLNSDITILFGVTPALLYHLSISPVLRELYFFSDAVNDYTKGSLVKAPEYVQTNKSFVDSPKNTLILSKFPFLSIRKVNVNNNHSLFFNLLGINHPILACHTPLNNYQNLFTTIQNAIKNPPPNLLGNVEPEELSLPFGILFSSPKSIFLLQSNNVTQVPAVDKFGCNTIFNTVQLSKYPGIRAIKSNTNSVCDIQIIISTPPPPPQAIVQKYQSSNKGHGFPLVLPPVPSAPASPPKNDD